MKIGIVGLEHVGSDMKELFQDAIIYQANKKNADTTLLSAVTQKNKMYK